MTSDHSALPGTTNLAGQIKESVSKKVVLVALEQPRQVVHCRGPEEVAVTFAIALANYPPSVMRLPFCVVLLDVSGLDTESETTGRRARRALNRVTSVIRGALRDGDIIVRYGQKRFALLLLGADEQASGKICQRIKEAIHRYFFIDIRWREPITLEFALTEHDPESGNDISELIFSNERNIRLAKSLGDGAIVTRSEAQDAFLSHRNFVFHLGDWLDSELLTEEIDD